MEKFIHLSVSNLRLDDLAGLSLETINVGNLHSTALGAVGIANLQKLNSAYNTMLPLMNKDRTSPLTSQITEEDKKRDALFTEIKRTTAAAQKSSLSDKAAAAAKLMDLLHPFWNIDKEPMLSQTAQINLFAERYHDTPAFSVAASTLGLTQVLNAFFGANEILQELYTQRLEETSQAEGPSASSVKREVVAAYDAFCLSVETTLAALPSAELQALFREMNNIRRKYISHLPVKLDEKNTSVEPINVQVYTGKHVTPLPRVFIKTEKETIELVFAQDFTVTYRHNIQVGEAKLLIHGKGKYTGTYETTFHIARI
jgi:hypothetical protein